MQQSNLPHSSLPHIDLILLLSPKGLPLHPSASRQRLSDYLLQTRRAVLGVCRGVTLSPSESQATGGRGRELGGFRGGPQDGGATCRRVTWFHCPQLIIAALPVGNLIHRGTWGDSGAPPTLCRLLFMVFFHAGLTARPQRTTNPSSYSPARVKLWLPLGLNVYWASQKVARSSLRPARKRTIHAGVQT